MSGLSLSRQSSMLASPDKEEQRKKEDESKGDLDPELKEIYAKIKEAEENYNDIRDLLIELADYFVKVDQKERAVSNYILAYEKASGAVDIKLDITFKFFLAGLKWQDLELMKKQVDQATQLFEDGGDWERKNKFKVYEAVYLMLIRQFKQAANNLLDTLATFTATELFDYQTFVYYTVVMSMVSLDRATIRSKVVHAPEILSVIREMPNLRKFMESLFRCEYAEFFKAFVEIMDSVSKDVYLSTHSRYWAREMRVVAYSQFLEAYRSVTIASMAQTFGVSSQFLDRELAELISSGRLACKIDKVSGVIESCRPDCRNALYQGIVKQGDLLLSRLQKLSRVLDV